MTQKRLLLLCLSALALCRPLPAADDVDTRIPVTTEVQDKTFVLIVSNEHYKYEQAVPFALNDGEVFKVYCEKTLGIPAKNIRHLADATLNDMTHELDWLAQVVEAHEGEAEAMVYYSGHGMPSEESKEACLLPVDGYSTSPKSGLATRELYERLGSLPSRRTMVFLDACFSGADRNGQMMAANRGVAIRAKSPSVRGSLVVFSAAQGTETAYPYQGHGHGMFTYFLLDKLNQTGGNVTLGDLSDYVVKQVRQSSILENGKSQTPVVAAAEGNTAWRGWKMSSSKAKKYETRTPSMAVHEPAAHEPDTHGGGTAAMQPAAVPAVPTAQPVPYTMPTYTIEGAGTGVQGSYLVKVTMTAKKPGAVSDADLVKCAVHGVLFRGFRSAAFRQSQRPLVGSALAEQQHAGFFGTFFRQDYQQYGQAEALSREVTKTGKTYQVSAVVSVMKDQLRKDLTRQGIIKGLTNGF